jgi:TRAP-type C4-dicarboxylate transport system permease small subunit
MEEVYMERVTRVVLKLSNYFSVVAEVTLSLMMIITVSDVILRAFNRPILGAYEVVSFFGAVAMGFSTPITSWTRGHVNVDLLTSKLSHKMRNMVNIGTRCLGIALFLLLSWRLAVYGMNLQRAAEVSMTLRLPFYPIAYGLAVSCLLQSIVLSCDILKIRGGQYE